MAQSRLKPTPTSEWPYVSASLDFDVRFRPREKVTAPARDAVVPEGLEGGLVRRLIRVTLAAVLLIATAAGQARAEDGYDLWLRYRPVEGAALKMYRSAAAELVIAGAESPTLRAVRHELTRGLEGLLGADLRTSERVSRDGAIVFGTPASSPIVAGLGLDLRALG